MKTRTSDANTSRKRHNSASAVELQASEIKWKRQCSAANSSAVESSSNIRIEKSLGDFPSEMLEAVLQKLPTSDLINCRLLNQKFNEIASRIMRKRADIQLHFYAAPNDRELMLKIQYCHCQEMLVNSCEPYEKLSSKSLKDLVVCLREAKHFPITSFRFDDLDKFGNEDMKSLLSIWGTNIVALDISSKDAGSDVGILRDLLVKTVPSLRKLQINFGRGFNPVIAVELFTNSNEFQLPNLQILRTYSSNNEAYRAVIPDILKAAPNLRNVYHFNSERRGLQMECYQYGITIDYLDMIQTSNKFHCLRDMRIELSEDLIRFLALQRIDFKLESFAVLLELESSQLGEHLKSSATAILNRVFQSSKDVIQTLGIGPLEPFGQDLNIPKMENLRKLEIFGDIFEFLNESEDLGLFSLPLKMSDSFPNLKELIVNNSKEAAFMFQTSQQLKPMPSIKVLRIIGKLPAECEENLLKATPNVTTLVIEENPWGFQDMENPNHVSINFRIIANCLPKLQSLGLPVNFCEKISKKFQNRVSLSADEISSHQLEQRTSSILDLKELKQFDVSFLLYSREYMDLVAEDQWGGCGWFVKKDEAGFRAGDALYRTGFSKVSKFLAFDLIPSLKVRTHRYFE